MTNQASKVSKGLRAIGANIINLADKTGVLEYSVNGVTKSLSLFDDTGKALSTFDVLSKVAEDWDKMTQAEQSNLSLAQAGKTQIDVYTAVLRNFDTALSANEVAMNSQGSAMKENAEYMESIEAKTKALQAQFELLVTGEGGLEGLIKGFLDFGTAMLKFANSDIGGLIIKTTLLLSSFKLLSMGVTAFNTLLKTGSSVNIFIFALQAITQGASTTSEAIGFLTTTMLKSPLFWGAIAIAGLYALVKVVDYFSVSLEEASESLSENKSIFDETVSTLKTLNDKLEETKDRMNEIESFKAPTLTDKEELNSLKEQNIELERQITLENERQLQASKKLADSASQVLNTEIMSEYKTQVDTYTYSDGETVPIYNYEKTTPEEELQSSIDKYKELEQSILDLDTAYDNGKLTLEDYETQQATLQTQQDSARTRALEMVEITNASEQAYKGIIDSKGELTKAEQAEYDRIVLINGQYYTFVDTIASDYVSATETAVESTKTMTDVLEELSTQLKEVNELSSLLGSWSLSDLESAWSVAQDALDSYNNSQDLTISQYEDLMSISPDLLALILDEDGNIKSLTDSYYMLYDAKIDNMAVDQALALVQKAIDMAGMQQDYADLTQSVDTFTTSLWGEVDGLMAVAMATKGMSTQSISVLTNQISTLKDWSTQAKANVRTYSGSTSAVKKNTSAVKDNNDELEDQIDNYEKVFGYMEDQIDKYIEKIEKRRDVEVDAIDAQIDALNRQNDAINEQIKLEELQANLANAKNTKVKIYKEGQGFVYETDVEAVSKAQQALDEFERTQTYNKQLQALEDYKDGVEANYDAQIEIYENYKNQFTDMTQAYELEQTRLLAEQLTGLNLESDLWITRLTNLSSYVNKYNALQKQLGSGTTNNSASTGSSGSSGGGSPTTSKYVASKAGMPSDVVKIINNQTKYVASKAGMPSQISGRATGDSGIEKDGIYRTGENPNTELIIGSKINGNVSRLDKGTGVVNAKSTSTLAGIINSLGQGFTNGKTIEKTNNNSISSSNNGINIYGAINVTANNVDEFAESIKRTFRTNMIQKAYE